jgi:hypothetical protein
VLLLLSLEPVLLDVSRAGGRILRNTGLTHTVGVLLLELVVLQPREPIEDELQPLDVEDTVLVQVAACASKLRPTQQDLDSDAPADGMTRL